ncbi:hypothetical protein PAXRUDRAFT_17005 [Paxillus rubicundulus Ve08.2h10]|uniref:Uncharacterized protein n=1 Tax=Paxillus rubicundulus Ve08.2h10 TaxID=930991 RepID=A0A0D0CS40_9AGAM|nr:hypothetical protein PAXRUDRAFT_17005 [Paxillus rubicundulus Ve08.2h10]
MIVGAGTLDNVPQAEAMSDKQLRQIDLQPRIVMTIINDLKSLTVTMSTYTHGVATPSVANIICRLSRIFPGQLLLAIPPRPLAPVCPRPRPRPRPGLPPLPGPESESSVDDWCSALIDDPSHRNQTWRLTCCGTQISLHAPLHACCRTIRNGALNGDVEGFPVSLGVIKGALLSSLFFNPARSLGNRKQIRSM